MRGLSAILTFPVAPKSIATPRVRVYAPAGEARGTLASVATDPDRELATLASRGDAQAFRQLVDRHRDRACAVARRIVRSDADAEEVAQDAFVRAWRALPEFRGESRFGTWLHAIVVRRALDRAEVLGRRRVREQPLEAAPHASVSAAVPELEAVRRARRLDALLGELSDMQRAAVALYYYEDQSVERVAEVLRIPENTVKTHLSRARTVLRSAWQREEAGS